VQSRPLPLFTIAPLAASFRSCEAWLSAVRVSRVRPPQKHADAAVEALIAGMPAWVDAAKVEAEYAKAKAKAPAPSFPSPYYPGCCGRGHGHRSEHEAAPRGVRKGLISTKAEQRALAGGGVCGSSM
jgi:hypothetical protein